jgi:hypothetical protein
MIRFQLRAPLILAGLAVASFSSNANAGFGESEYGNAQDNVSVGLGVRGSFVPSEGLDPFADNDLIMQGALSLGASILSDEAFTFAGVAGFDWGGRSDEARGAKSELDICRLSLGPEFRFYPAGRVYFFARVIPTFAYTGATVTTPDAELSDSNWLWGFDASGGGAVGFLNPSKKQKFQLWITGEFGYGWSTSKPFALTDTKGPRRAEPVMLPDLSLSGMFFRVQLVATAF